MAKKGYKGITVNALFFDNFMVYCKEKNNSMNEMLENILIEREKLQKFASKIQGPRC